MLKKNEIATPTSCLNHAADDEPIFVLRANDESAPDVVEAWAAGYIVRKGGFEKMTAKQRSKWGEARDLARQMRIWKIDNGR